MKCGSRLNLLFVFLIVPNSNSLQLILDNSFTNGIAGLFVSNVSQSIIHETGDLASSLALIEYRYVFIDDDDINDKGLSRGVLSALGRRRRRRSVPIPQLFRCLGNLISSKFVLTAASCVKYTGDYKPFTVRLADKKNIAIEDIIVHENYRANIPENFEDANKNNIALIKLITKATLSQQVTFIGLQTKSVAIPLTINWRLLDDGVLMSNITSMPNVRDNERYKFEVMPTHVYVKESNLSTPNCLQKIIADGGIGTEISEYIEWIKMNF